MVAYRGIDPSRLRRHRTNLASRIGRPHPGLMDGTFDVVSLGGEALASVQRPALGTTAPVDAIGTRARHLDRCGNSRKSLHV
ncbi:hypothetical protein [Methylobacterium sp. WL116]|uniref:hypothetical protein n=1 Tax=Methylobacterium sp. WL116 TaxID=2603889 RepID=UPI0011CB6DAF|nr:hypothetical protein [Methylobacterium sp. WL116]TXM95079.1 hypothetical protein FV223_02090 [Methylobacterium sp. WL116]